LPDDYRLCRPSWEVPRGGAHRRPPWQRVLSGCFFVGVSVQGVESHWSCCLARCSLSVCAPCTILVIRVWQGLYAPSCTKLSSCLIRNVRMHDLEKQTAEIATKSNVNSSKRATELMFLRFLNQLLFLCSTFTFLLLCMDQVGGRSIEPTRLPKWSIPTITHYYGRMEQ
jgi:hypothetical protein